MAESIIDREENEMLALEHEIILAMAHIKKSRSRPCYKNILSSLEREGKELTIEDLKVLIGNMLRKNLIANIGKKMPSRLYW